ncbi:MAG TPA: hypothetical protein VHZ32_11630 [Rhizomicrobium sp.]|nr:hypothetical protein [Rhizomicrobium sp.]
MRLAAAILLAVSVAGAAAQPTLPTEHVTVTGTRSHDVIQGFVQSFIAPARMTGKIARWQDGICLTALGLKPIYLKFIMQRLRDTAAKVGAPVNADSGCKPNVEIVFTTAPQALADGLKKTHEIYLGYADNKDQLAKLATVTHPIQAWYATQTKDARGMAEIDNPKGGGVALTIWVPEALGQPEQFITMDMPHAHGRNVTGSRLGDGLSSSFYHVIIAADPNQLKDYEIGALADYIAMLALTQLDSLDTCQQLPSIVNMLAKGCDRPANALTENDLAYLRGLYKMSAERDLRVQRDEMTYQMEQGLEGK